jgi:hypothetical protein
MKTANRVHVMKVGRTIGAGTRSKNLRSLPYAPACTWAEPYSAVNINMSEMIPLAEAATLMASHGFVAALEMTPTMTIGPKHRAVVNEMGWWIHVAIATKAQRIQATTPNPLGANATKIHSTRMGHAMCVRRR